MANQLTDENILAALGGVKDPEIGRDLVSLGMVKQITIDGSVVDLTVELTTPACPLKATIENDIGDALTPLGREPRARGLGEQREAQLRRPLRRT
jgi:ATP-binding protein involved in chromosome partitioning